MHADTDAIRDYGTATSDLGADLHAAVAPLRSVAAATVTAAFGPIGSRFAQTVAYAADALSKRLNQIGDDVMAAGSATTAAAADFDDTERCSQTHIAHVGA
ncbi:MAG: hypothetical protein ACM4D3_00905 [Candidatus Sericytochromatia bacterium]